MQNDECKPAGQKRYEDSLKKNPTMYGSPRKDWASLEGYLQRMWAAPEMNKRLEQIRKK